MRIFCFICKRHIDCTDEKAFRRSGHDNTKTNRTLRGPVGVYKTLAEMQREQADRDAARAAKEVEATVHAE